MKRLAVFVLGVMMVSTGALAQAPAPAVETPLLAAPANLREAATVIKWKPDFTYDTLKKGTGRLVCYDESGLPSHQVFAMECTTVANLDRVAQNLKLEAAGGGHKITTQPLLNPSEQTEPTLKPQPR